MTAGRTGAFSCPQHVQYGDSPGTVLPRSIIQDTTDDDARPDREESELLFGEAISWLGPEPALVRATPAPPPVEDVEASEDPLDEPEPALAEEPPVVDEEPIIDEPSPEPLVLAAASVPTEARAATRRRNLLIAAGAAAAVLVVVAIFALSGGGDSADVVAANHPAPGKQTVTTRNAPVTSPTTPPTTSDQTTTAEGTSVTVNADVLFDVGSAALSPTASTRLGGVLALARTDTNRRLLIEGFTDSDGDPTLNQQLSERRAQSVAQWLIDQGIDPARISVVGHGADSAISPNDTPEHKALNRRVVVTLQTATP